MVRGTDNLNHGQTMIYHNAELRLASYVMFRKARMEKGEEECYYTLRRLCQRTKYSYIRKQIGMGPYGAN